MLFDVLVVIFIIIGVLGTLLPGIPGTPAVFLAIAIHSWVTDFTIITGSRLFFLLFLMLLAQGAEYLASFLSAKYYGASKFGILGTLFGTIVGLIFLGPVGLILGALVGAMVFELFSGKSIKQAAKVGFATVIGSLGGSVFSFIVAVIMGSIFINNLLAG